MSLKILQINVRLSEGGAAQVALSLHVGAQKSGLESYFGYGYSKGAKPSIFEPNFINVESLSEKPEVIWSFIQNRFFGYESSFSVRDKFKRLEKIILAADVVHLHAIHSYFLDYKLLLSFLVKIKKNVVWTLHDHWAVTGRCAFTDGCGSWKAGCGNCLTKKNYPPSFFDFSESEAEIKRSLLNQMRNQCLFISPSHHLANDFNYVYPDLNISVIPNSINATIESEFESNIYSSGLLPLYEPSERQIFNLLVVAHDLSYRGKTDFDLISKLGTLPNVMITTVGKNSPFSGASFRNLGEIHSRSVMASVYLKADALVFSSVVDNFPLTICEALCAGLPTLATKSHAASEVLAYVSARAGSFDEIVDIVSNGLPLSLYSNIKTREQLRLKALENFAAASMVESYINVYAKSIKHKAH